MNTAFLLIVCDMDNETAEQGLTLSLTTQQLRQHNTSYFSILCASASVNTAVNDNQCVLGERNDTLRTHVVLRGNIATLDQTLNKVKPKVRRQNMLNKNITKVSSSLLLSPC